MIIDFHTHTFPEEIANKAIPKIAKNGNIKNYTNGTKNELIKSMKDADIDYSVILPIATKPTQTSKLNSLAAKTNEDTQKSGLISFGTIHPDNENYLQILTELKYAGIKGIKLHPFYQDFSESDTRIADILYTAESLGLITIFHARLDVSYPGINMAAPSYFYKLYNEIKPQKLVLAHMGGWGFWDEADRLLSPLPIYFDISFCLGEIEGCYPDSRIKEECKRMSNEQFVTIVRNHGADKILFGSDSPWGSQKETITLLEKTGLSNSELKMIKSENARKLLSI